MRTPGGDLAPARRHRYRASHGRRRHVRNVRLGLALVLLLVAGGTAYLMRVDDSQAPTRLATRHACATTPPATTASPRLVAALRPPKVRLVLLNGTARNGLAKHVGDALAARGFVVTAQANAPSPLAGASHVVWGPGALPSATLVAWHVHGARAVSNPRAPRGSVRVVLGSAFQRVATPVEVAAARRTLLAAGAGPAPRPSACAS